MKPICVFMTVAAIVSCKSRPEAASDASSVIVTGGQTEVFTATRARDLLWSGAEVGDEGVTVVNPLAAKAKPAAEPDTFDYSSHVCHFKDCSEESADGVTSMVCKTLVGTTPVSSVLKIIEANPDDEKLADVLLAIISPENSVYSDKDPDVIRAKDFMAPLFQRGAGASDCDRSFQIDDGLSLTGKLFGRKVHVHNETGRDLVFKAVVDYSEPDAKVYKESPWLSWKFASGKSAYISYKNLSPIYSVQYKAYVDGKLVQDNGNGIRFDKAGADYVIRITGSGSVADRKYAPSASLSVEQCALMLKMVHDRYPKHWFQKSDYKGERARCYAAAEKAATDGAKWTTMMKWYYCEHPGIPVRDCFTPLAGLLRKTIFPQKIAYRIGFEYCKNTSGFESMSPAMVNNFKQIMLNKWEPTDNKSCMTRFNQMSE